MKTFRKALVLVLVLALALVLTGCMQFNVDIKVNSDKSASIDVKEGILSSYYDMVVTDDSNPFSDLQDAADKYGFTVGNYSNSDYKGVELKGTIADVTNPNGAMGEFLAEDNVFKTETVDGKEVITFSCPVSGVTDGITGSANASLESLEEYGKLDLKITVTMPYAVTESNATEVKGNTCTWDLLKFTGSSMTASCKEGKSGGGVGIGLIIGIVAAIAVVAVVIVVLLKKKPAAPAPEAPVEG